MNTEFVDNCNNNLLAKTLDKLISSKGGLTPSSLAKQLGIPTNKITRIINGDVTDPKASTLLQIASFFDIGIEQLLGIKPIEISNTTEDVKHSILLPVYHIENGSPSSDWYRWAYDEKKESAVAIKVDTDLYEPIIPLDSTLIVDRDEEVLHRSYIIIKEPSNNRFIVRRIIFDGNSKYIHPINTGFNIEQYDNIQHEIFGVILEVHQKMSK